MAFIADNWFIIVAIAAVLLLAGVGFWLFLRLPREKQIEAVREWLLMAVTEAERELGGGTGQLKLRFVYDRFVVRFPWLAKTISFVWFSTLVDEALVGMKDMLANNDAVKEYVNGKGETA